MSRGITTISVHYRNYLFLACVSPLLAGCNGMHGFANNQIGTAYYKQGNYAMARSEFQRAVANDPYNADYVYNLATSRKRQGDMAGAEQSYRQAMAMDPSHQPTYHGLALMLKEQGRTNEAVDTLQTWLDTQPYSPEPYVEMAWLKREMGDIAGSEQLLLGALKVKPNDSVATAHLGQLYQDTNQPDRAIAMYRRSLYTRWYQPEVKSRLATLEQSHPQTNVMTAYAGGAPLQGPLPPTYAYYQTPRMAQQQAIPTYTTAMPPGAAPMAPIASQQPVRLLSPTADADPAHSDERISAHLPVVRPH